MPSNAFRLSTILKFDETKIPRSNFPASIQGSGFSMIDSGDILPISGIANGYLAYRSSELYMYNENSWLKIGTTNDAPTAIAGVNAAYTLNTDGTPTIITAASTDPEGFPLTWSYAVTSGTLGDTATISQLDNVFTINPSSVEAHAGTFSITISATDGTNITTKVVDFSLNFYPPIYDTIQTISNPSATPDYDRFGYAVDVNNSGTMVIGAYGAGTLPWPTGTPDGKAYIYDNTGSLVSTLSNPSPGGVGPGSGPMDWFGTHVSIGNYVAVTATQDDYSSTYTDTGAVYIFSTSGSYLRKIANPQPNESQLRDVKMSGSYAIIANKNYNLGGYTGIDGTWHSGAVYVYNAGNGSLTRTIMNPNPYGTVQLDYFGAAIAVDGNKLMVYAAGEDDAAGALGGSVYVYNNFLSGGPDHTITNPNPYGTRNSDNFGNYMDIYGNYAVIAAHSEDDSDGTNVGSAYIYETTNWTVLHTLVNPNPDGVTANDYFGRGVAINSEYCFVWGDEGSTGGVVYVYKNSTGEFMTKIENPNQYDTPTGDEFGKAHALAVSDNGNYLAVGASSEDAASGSGAGVAFLITSSNPNAPVSITGVNSTYEIAYSGSALVITAISSDPDGSALTWSYSISGLTNNEATVSQSGNVFTVTPSGLISNLGTFALTIEVTDGGYTVTQTTDITVSTVASPSSILYTNSGTTDLDFTFTVPTGITSISMVLVGGGGGGAWGSSQYGSNSDTSWTPTAGGGGGLKWISDFTVTPGDTHSIRVGRKGRKDTSKWGNMTGTSEGGTSWFGQAGTASGDDGTSYISAMGGGKGKATMNSNLSTTPGDPSMGGSNTISAAAIALASSHGGGNGGNGAWRNVTDNPNGGGGAAGYSGNGGKGRNWGGTPGNYGEPISATSYYGTGGGGAGGLGDIVNAGSYSNQSGGGVGVYGEGSSGTSYGAVGSGGDYGGGGHAGPGAYNATSRNPGDGGGGAVRIMWGAGRSYPSTNVDNTYNIDTETVY